MMPIDPVSARLALEGGADADPGARQKVALEEMEHLFLNTLMKEMRKSVPDGGLFKKDAAMKIFEEMLDDVFSGEMAKSGQLGIAKAMETQLVQQKEALGQRTLLHTAVAVPALAPPALAQTVKK